MRHGRRPRDVIAKTRLVSSGNSLAVRVPESVCEMLDMKVDDEVTMQIGDDGALIVRKADNAYERQRDAMRTMRRRYARTMDTLAR